MHSSMKIYRNNLDYIYVIKRMMLNVSFRVRLGLDYIYKKCLMYCNEIEKTIHNNEYKTLSYFFSCFMV
jgi:hypothetical protein